MSERLSNRLVDALDELGRHERNGRGPYWWRTASMRLLAEKQYVVPWHPEGTVQKCMAHRLTDRGREFLAGFPSKARGEHP